MLGSWRAVGESLCINRGELCAVANGKRRATARILNALGLPPDHIEVQPLACGHAPLAKHCAICTPVGDARKRKRIDITSLKSDDAAFVRKFIEDHRSLDQAVTLINAILEEEK